MLSRENLKGLSLPALLLDIDAFDDNCQQIAAKANGKKIRIATKSLRSLSVIQRILHSNPIFQGVMCFSPHEAIFLEKQGIDDILLGYPCYDQEALSLIAKSSASIVLMVDSIDHLEHLDRIAKKVNGSFKLCIDVDMSTKFAGLHFGVRRSPIQNADEVVRMAQKIKHSDYLCLKGIMGYEAQIAGVGDQMPSQFMKNTLVSYLKKKSIKKIENRRRAVVDFLTKDGFSLEIVNGGGTGSLETTCQEEFITEVTVGSGFYSPLLFDYYHNFKYSPSLFYALPIVRKPTANIVTCLGGGYVSSGPAGNDKVPQPIYPGGGKLLPLEGAGEVQTPVFYQNHTLKIGDAVVFRAAKSGEICERFNEIVVFSEQTVIDRFKTYRGNGVCFL
nr:amino acid deaminase/aldolase [Bacillus sp. AP8]